MVDPLTVATNLVAGISSRVAKAKTNEEECRLVARFAEHTLRMLENFGTKDLSDPSISTSLELLYEALDEASKAIEKCCNAAFLSALLWPESYSLPLKRAVENLGVAMSQVCFASLSMTSQIESMSAALLDQLHHADLSKREAIARQTDALKKELKKGFHQQSQDHQEVKRLIQELMQRQTSTMQDVRDELKMLNKAISEAKENKEKQMEDELKQIIQAILDSIIDANQGQVLIANLKRILCCPIANVVMKDPVLLKESGVIFDRSSITKRLQRGHFIDPVANVELVSACFVRCYALRDVCHELAKNFGDSSNNVGDSKEANLKNWFAAGLYEGRGKISIGLSTFHVFQLLFLKPNGEAMGCTLYNKRETVGIQRKGLEIGYGEWNQQRLELYFGDSWFSYNGRVYRGSCEQQAMLKWKGKTSNFLVPHREHGFIFVYSLPCIRRSLTMCPRILYMESEVVAVQNNLQCTSKLVVSLEIDFTINGWLWFESIGSKCETIGRIIGGEWDLNGQLVFQVYFSTLNTKLSCYKERSNYLNTFQIFGYITHSNISSPPAFIAKFERTGDGKTLQSNRSLSLLPRDGDTIEYPYLREASAYWHYLLQSPLKFFEETKSISKIIASFPNLLCNKVMNQNLMDTLFNHILILP